MQTKGHCGHGLVSVLTSGAFGIISSCVTDLQPCLIAVPTQSLPVSPPPITITFLSFALIYLPSVRSESRRLLVVAVRKSTAKYIPSASLPGALISLGLEAPTASTTAS